MGSHPLESFMPSPPRQSCPIAHAIMGGHEDLALDIIDRASKEGSFNPDQLVALPPGVRPLDYSNTPLEDRFYSLTFLAARMGQGRLLEALVREHGATWDFVLSEDLEEHSTLCAAVWSGDVYCLQFLLYLLESEADEEGDDIYDWILGGTACDHCEGVIFNACRHGSLAQVKLLMEEYDVMMDAASVFFNHRIGMRRMLIHVAAEYTKSFPILKFLLDEAGPDLDPNTPILRGPWDGETVLHLACKAEEGVPEKDVLAVVEYLLKRGCDKTIKNAAGQTAADLARAFRLSKVYDRLTLADREQEAKRAEEALLAELLAEEEEQQAQAGGKKARQKGKKQPGQAQGQPGQQEERQQATQAGGGAGAARVSPPPALCKWIEQCLVAVAMSQDQPAQQRMEAALSVYVKGMVDRGEVWMVDWASKPLFTLEEAEMAAFGSIQEQGKSADEALLAELAAKKEERAQQKAMKEKKRKAQQKARKKQARKQQQQEQQQQEEEAAAKMQAEETEEDEAAATAAAAVGALSVQEQEEEQEQEQEDDEQEQVAFMREGAPFDVVCPLSGLIMVNAMVAADGHTYEEQAIVAFRDRCKAEGAPFTSPVAKDGLPRCCCQTTWCAAARGTGWVEKRGKEWAQAKEESA